VEIEVEALQDLAHTSVLPAAYKQQTVVAKSIRNFLETAQLAGLDNKAGAAQSKNLQRIANLIAGLETKLEELDQKSKQASSIDLLEEKARFYAYEVMTACSEVREQCDRIEEVVDDQIWPLPKYREMLFLN